MQQLLSGNIRLPIFSDDWLTNKLGDIASMGAGGTPLTSVAEYYGGNIPWVSISDMTDTPKIILHTERKLTKKGLSNSSATIFPEGTILLAMYASIGECCIAGVPLSTSQAILGINTSSILETEYLYYFLDWKKNELISKGQQGTQSNLNKNIVQNIIIDFPPLEEQNLIVEVLSDIDKDISFSVRMQDKVIDLKHGLMQELLTGKTRLV